MFPGIEPSRIIGKSFETFALDVQIIKDGLIKRTWHFEDWTAALGQLLGEPKQFFQNPREEPGELLTEIPESIKNFYDKVMRDPLGQGQNVTLVNSIFNPNLKYEREHIFLCGDHVVALYKITGTITRRMP